ncbi:hypothetical protein FRB95_008371 [Tulasnella sp. JGI-2019a]|nr:hypothetical protein FRB93_006874 [Tulasnella sp. JGI-2019a]KAG9026849.1 hypothetical protein FRB95_008371 [Tulasnella sp. JGI-2019a]
MSNTNTNSDQPGYVEQTTNLFNAAAETISSYLPTSMKGANTNHTTGMKEDYGVGGHPESHGGVGDLGTDGTTDVVRLPDERSDNGPLQGAAGAAYTSGAAGFGVTSSADNATDTFAAPNTTKSSNTTSTSYSGKGLQSNQFDGLDKIHPETSGTTTTAPLSGSGSQYGSADQTLANINDADNSKTFTPTQT